MPVFWATISFEAAIVDRFRMQLAQSQNFIQHTTTLGIHFGEGRHGRWTEHEGRGAAAAAPRKQGGEDEITNGELLKQFDLCVLQCPPPAPASPLRSIALVPVRLDRS
jgi:hypothetical protein